MHVYIYIYVRRITAMCEKMEERVREEGKRREKWGEIEQAYLRAKVWKNVALGLERGVDDQVSTTICS